MKPILQNLVEMTGHRDHLRLAVSVLSTLQSLSSVVQVRSLEVFTVNDAYFVRPITWMDKDQWVSAESEAAQDPLRQPITEIPALLECIQARSASAAASAGGVIRSGAGLPHTAASMARRGYGAARSAAYKLAAQRGRS